MCFLPSFFGRVVGKASCFCCPFFITCVLESVFSPSSVICFVFVVVALPNLPAPSSYLVVFGCAVGSVSFSCLLSPCHFCSPVSVFPFFRSLCFASFPLSSLFSRHCVLHFCRIFILSSRSFLISSRFTIPLLLSVLFLPVLLSHPVSLSSPHLRSPTSSPPVPPASSPVRSLHSPVPSSSPSVLPDL